MKEGFMGCTLLCIGKLTSPVVFSRSGVAKASMVGNGSNLHGHHDTILLRSMLTFNKPTDCAQSPTTIASV